MHKITDMRKRIMLISLLMLGLAVLSCRLGQPTSQAQSTSPAQSNTSAPHSTQTQKVDRQKAGRIEGKVYWLNTNALVDKANVILIIPAEDPANPKWPLEQAGEYLTDSTGNYVFDNLKPGRYEIGVILNFTKYQYPFYDLSIGNVLCVKVAGAALYRFEGKDGEGGSVSEGHDSNTGDHVYSAHFDAVDISTVKILQRDLYLPCS